MVAAKFKTCFFCFLVLSLQGEKIRVASFNVENYLVMDRMVSGKWQPNYPKPAKEKRALRALINQIKPDILAIQEIGKTPFLKELWQDLNSTGGMQYHDSAWMHGSTDEEERHLAFLTRIPISKVHHHTDLAFNYFETKESPSRGLLEVEFDLNGTRWSVFNLHLKSKWTERQEDPDANLRREKEARKIRDFIRKRYPPTSQYPHLVLGDFNDHKNSQALARFCKVNDQILAVMIPCVDSNGHFWTHYYDKQDSYSRFDYILASPSILPKWIEGKAFIADQHFSLWASDHRMIYADFEF